MKKSILFFSSLWLFCFLLVAIQIFWITEEDKIKYQKQQAQLTEKKAKQSIVQNRINIKKELYSDTFSGKIYAKTSAWVFQPKDHIFKEEFKDFTAEIHQDNLTKTICSKKGSFDFHSYNLNLTDCKTCAPLLMEDGNKIMITSFSKNACFHLDPKQLQFSLEKTHTNIKK